MDLVTWILFVLLVGVVINGVKQVTALLTEIRDLLRSLPVQTHLEYLYAIAKRSGVTATFPGSAQGPGGGS